MARNRINKNHPYAYASPSLIIMFILVVLPIAYNIFVSFTNLNLYHWRKYQVIGVSNYIRIITSLDTDFYAVFLRTIMWTAVNVVLMLFLGIMLALLLNMKELKFKGIMRTILILPWAVPSYITALMWKGMFNYDFGIINGIIEKLGMQRIEWLTDPINAMIASIIVNVWLSVPFMMIVALGALQSIDKTFYEAADIDGAGTIKKFFYITLPFIKPAMIPAVILTAFMTFKQFDIIYLMTNGLAGKTDVVMTYGYKLAFDSKNYSLSAAFSVIIFIVLLVLTVLNMKLSWSDREV